MGRSGQRKRSGAPAQEVRSTTSNYNVFISHSGKDRWIARQLMRLIEATPNATAFLDERDLEGGNRIDDTVRKRIQMCDEFVVLFSSASAKSAWVKAEIAAAWALEKRVVVLVDKLSAKDLEEELPPVVREVKRFDLNDAEAYLDQLEVRAARSA